MFAQVCFCSSRETAAGNGQASSDAKNLSSGSSVEAVRQRFAGKMLSNGPVV